MMDSKMILNNGYFNIEETKKTKIQNELHISF